LYKAARRGEKPSTSSDWPLLAADYPLKTAECAEEEEAGDAKSPYLRPLPSYFKRAQGQGKKGQPININSPLSII